MANVDEEAAEVMKDIRERGDTDKMSKEEWRDFLRTLIDDLQIELEAAGE